MLRILLSVLFLAAAIAAAHSEPVFPPGGRTGLEPAVDLKVSNRFLGFEDADRNVTVMILELPAGEYTQIMRSTFSDDQPGLTNVKRESFPFKAGIGYLLAADTTENGVAVRRFFLVGVAVTGQDPDFVGLIKVGVPEAARGIYSDEVIRGLLASVSFREVPIEEQIAHLPFKLDEFGGFRVLRTLPDGAVILIDGAGNDLTRQPYMIVSIGRGAPDRPDDRGRMARDLLAGAPLRDLTVQLAEPLRIVGAPGYEIRAQATTPNGNPVTLVQWVRFGSAGYLRIIGAGPRQAWDDLFPRFRAVRDGIAIR